MKKLLRFEFHKLKRQKSIYICTLVLAVMLLISCLSTKLLLNLDEELAEILALNYSGLTFMLGAASNSSFLMIAGIVIALLLCDDFDLQTIKNIYAKGYSRTQVYFAKLFSILTAVTVMYFATLLFGFSFGSLFFSVGKAGEGLAVTLAVQYLSMLANVCFFFMLTSLIRKMGLSIAAAIVVPIVMELVLVLGDALLNLENFRLQSMWVSSFVTDTSALPVSDGRLIGCVVGAVIYIAVFTLLGSLLSKRNEL